METLQGKHIWIIGASSGIGAALAKELAVRGAILALSARRADKLQEVAAGLNGSGHICVSCDAGDPSSVRAAFTDITQSFQRLDSVLFMPAVYRPHDGAQKPLSFIHEALNVNLGGAFNMLDCITPYFRAQGSGQIVLCASVAGYRGLPTGQPYCATKAALISLAESLKIDLEPDHIDVKVICPGFVKTPLTDKNDFPMPMMIAAEDAARIIANELISNRFEIHFPKKFTFIMKTLRLLPTFLYFFIARRLRERAV